MVFADEQSGLVVLDSDDSINSSSPVRGGLLAELFSTLRENNMIGSAVAEVEGGKLGGFLSRFPRDCYAVHTKGGQFVYGAPRDVEGDDVIMVRFQRPLNPAQRRVTDQYMSRGGFPIVYFEPRQH